VVEVQKRSALGLRIASDPGNGLLRNPKVGAWREIGRDWGIVCTTGYPFAFFGTVRPLNVRIARGNLELVKVLQDTFEMSQLCWPVPNRCMRLPIDIKLCDEHLRSVAAEADDDEAVYGDDFPATDGSEQMTTSIR
jgi:hypothetical protein